MDRLNEINKTDEFEQWLQGLKDLKAKIAIARRIERAEHGNFGDHKFLRDEISELRIDTGKGYRVYYAQQGRHIYLLVCGGDKTTQAQDIKRAIQLWASIKQQETEYEIH